MHTLDNVNSPQTCVQKIHIAGEMTKTGHSKAFIHCKVLFTHWGFSISHHNLCPMLLNNRYRKTDYKKKKKSPKSNQGEKTSSSLPKIKSSSLQYFLQLFYKSKIIS